ncbi:MAG: NADPH-dependent FMN reductase, partial [Verrucomicrobiota bacterium]
LLLTNQVGATLRAKGFAVGGISVRDLPPDDLLYGRAESPVLASALALVARAQGVIVTTPVYKAAYTGVLKTFLDLLPQSGLSGKVVLPMVTGGTIAHVLAIDYALRPVLLALGAQHVVAGLFVLDRFLERTGDGGLRVGAEIADRLAAVVDDFADSLWRQHPRDPRALPPAPGVPTVA